MHIKQKLKKMISGILIVLMLCVALSSCSSPQSIGSSATRNNENETTTVPQLIVPISSEDLQNHDYKELAEMFSEAGFSKITADAVCDQDPDEMTADFINEVSISGRSRFSKGDSADEDSAVSIICHLPYVKYDLVIHINFIPNLLFSKYDVKYDVDGKETGTIKHGEDTDLEFRLKEGAHTITFSESGASTNKTDIEFDLRDDIEAEYKLSCSNDKITFENVYIKNAVASLKDAVLDDGSRNIIDTVTDETITTAITEPTTEKTPATTVAPVREATEPEALKTDYILNKNTLKFHHPGCRAVKDMKEKNKEYFHGTREEVLARGFVPCGICNP